MRSRADDQKRIHEISLVQNGGLSKHEDRTHGQEELLAPGCEGWQLMYHGGGKSKERGGFNRIFIC